jgi:2-hydroxy-3-keto-5-methylthiopentenyl-1-phosphate phosphatase
MAITWESKAQEHFNKIMANLPQFHRSIAQQLVKEKAEELAQGRGSDSVEDKDVIVAFFQEVPPAFKDMMKRLLHQQGIDYRQYIHE